MNFNQIHHIGIAVESIAKAELFYVDCLGMEKVSEIIHDPVQNVNLVLLAYSQSRGSGPMIELIEPTGEPGPVDRFVGKGASLYHYCVEVESIDAALRHLRQSGAIIIQKPVEAVLFDRRRIAWVISPAGHLLELLEADST